MMASKYSEAGGIENAQWNQRRQPGLNSPDVSVDRNKSSHAMCKQTHHEVSPESQSMFSIPGPSSGGDSLAGRGNAPLLMCHCL